MSLAIWMMATPTFGGFVNQTSGRHACGRRQAQCRVEYQNRTNTLPPNNSVAATAQFVPRFGGIYYLNYDAERQQVDGAPRRQFFAIIVSTRLSVALGYLAVRAVLDDGVTLVQGFEVSQKAVRRARVDADGCRVLRGNVRGTLLQHCLREFIWRRRRSGRSP